MGSSSQPAAPSAPDYGAANRQGILTDVETLPMRRMIDNAARMGTAGSFMLDGKSHDFDFTGLGDAALASNQAGIDRQSAFSNAQNLLDIQGEFGGQFLQNSRDQLQASDPIGFALRETLGQSVSDDLALGGEVSESDQRRLSQSVLAAQTQRGNVRGMAPAVQEVLAQDGYSRGLKQSRQANAASFLNGTSPVSQFGQLNSAQGGAAPWQVSGSRSAFGINQGAGAAAANFAQQTFGTQANIFGTQSAAATNATNPWMEGLGMAGGLAGQLGSAAMLCWVAREVYGAENPRWLLFRKWMLTQAPKWLLGLYLKFGARFADWLKGRDRTKAVIRNWMDKRIEELN
tara:strand:+ start:1154 stop:2188 length:1035 start_codon:yes stop_codon:yes gene_type:complete